MKPSNPLKDDPLDTHLSQVKSFFRNYTRGFSSSDFRRLFDREARDAFTFLSRNHQDAPSEPAEEAGTFDKVRAFFLGISYKLSPPRRVLFAVSLILGFCAVFFSFNLTLGADRFSLTIDSSPLLTLLSVSGLVLLLALELVDRVRVKDELELARELQEALLPTQAPELPGWRMAHSYRTANTVGGDYYNFPVLEDGRVALMVGDASGHGMAAGLLMAIADATLFANLERDPDPCVVADQLNQALTCIGGSRAFMSFFYALLDPATGELDYVCAGHPYPLLRRRDGTVEELGQGGFPLGLRRDLAIRRGQARMEAGDLLVLYTDGVAECVDGEGRAFGFDRLRRTVAVGGSAPMVHDAVLAAFDRHRGDERLTDDVTLLTVERIVDGSGDDPLESAPPPPPPPPA